MSYAHHVHVIFHLATRALSNGSIVPVKVVKQGLSVRAGVGNYCNFPQRPHEPQSGNWGCYGELLLHSPNQNGEVCNNVVGVDKRGEKQKLV